MSYAQSRRLVLLAVLAALLTGCVTVVVPTATPVPTTDRPIVVTGQGDGVYAPVELVAGGGYAASWKATGGHCEIALDLATPDGSRPVAGIVPFQTVTFMLTDEKAPDLNVSAGTYSVVATSTCPWTVTLTRLP